MGKTVGGKSRLFFKVSPTYEKHFKAHDMGTDSYRDMRTVVQSQSVGVKFLLVDWEKFQGEILLCNGSRLMIYDK